MFISCVSPEACPGKACLSLSHTHSLGLGIYDKII